MHLECHAILGWLIGNGGGAKDRQVRNYTVIGAILPDIDAIPYIFGPHYYGLLHHTFGHNVFLWVAWSWVGWWRFRSYRAAILGFVGFGSHLLTDAFLSNWPLYLFWPVSPKGYLPANSLELSSPVNTYLLYSTPLFVAVGAFLWKRTPLEWISPKLDALFLSFFRGKPLVCSECARGANFSCEACQKPICPRHMQVGPKWAVRCEACRESDAASRAT